MLFFILRFIAMLQQEKRKKEDKWDIPKLKVVITCTKCDYREQVEYKEGYFVGQKFAKLCKCGGEKIIDKIYHDEKTEKDKKWERYQELFR